MGQNYRQFTKAKVNVVHTQTAKEKKLFSTSDQQTVSGCFHKQGLGICGGCPGREAL